MIFQGSLHIIREFLAKLPLPPLLLRDVEEVDYISKLPDDILEHIQSMLTIHDMMSTSILSKRWCNLWHLRRNLNFNVPSVFGSEEKLRGRDIKGKFVERIDQFVKNFKGTKIDSFMVELYHLRSIESTNIDQWTKFAISKGVERIVLVGPWYAHRDVYRARDCVSCDEFPFGLSFECNNSTLKYVHLKFFHVRNPTNFDPFPFKKLRSLVIEESTVDVKLLTTLLSNCRLLEELSFIECLFNSTTLQIESSSLCHFKLDQCQEFNTNADEVDIELTSLDCLKLTSLYYHIRNNSSISLFNAPLPIVMKSSINAPKLKTIYHDEVFSVEKLHRAFTHFATFPKLEILNLYIFSYPRPRKNVPELQGIQTLKNLRQFNLSINANNVSNFEIWRILSMLQAFPLLQKLTINMRYPDPVYCNHEIQKDIQDVMSLSHDEIKVIELRGCVGHWYEIEFALNALKYIHKLERIVLNPYWIHNWSERDWEFNPTWYQIGRERILKKLQDEGIELDKLVLR